DELFDHGQSNVLRLDRKQAQQQHAAEAPAGAGDPGPEAGPGIEREWYLVEEGVQVGPLIRAEIEERWAARDIDHNTLVWKQGMADWATISDTPELLYLITRRPQTTPHVIQGARPVTRKPLESVKPSPSSPAIELTQEVGPEDPQPGA